jgi:hypothetical protein
LKEGAVTYTPRIGTTQTPVSFKVIRQTGDEVVFENLAHDFPQRILYRPLPGGLFARIEGSKSGGDRHEDFPMKRVSCDGR